MDGATVTNELCFKALIDNTVVVEHKYKHSLSIKIGNNYEREEQ